MASLDELKQKYAGVFQVLEHDGANIQTVEMQGDQLHLVATVVSEASKDRVWDAIKAADPSFSDLAHEITVAQGDQTYTVKAGDNLSKISKLFYGDANQYQKIAEANGLDNPGQNSRRPDTYHSGGITSSQCARSPPPARAPSLPPEPLSARCLTCHLVRLLFPLTSPAHCDTLLGSENFMTSILSSGIVEVAIGLAFVYLLLSLLCSVVNEWIAGIHGLTRLQPGEGNPHACSPMAS